jgi:FtsP/CotA-like multicopper oxidase with cupredoxin domain
MLTRRQFMKWSAFAGAATLVADRLQLPAAFAGTIQTPLAGGAIPQFRQALPLLHVAGGPIETVVAGADELTLRMQEFRSLMLPPDVSLPAGPYAGTWTWGYRIGQTSTSPAGTYIGPAIVATRGMPTQVRYVNDLGSGAGTRVIGWYNATDQTLHWANPLGDAVSGNLSHYSGPIPAVPHLHGGDVPAQIDGGPDAWFTSDGDYRGHAYYTKAGAAANEAIYRYPNVQEAASIWFHDHVLGLTRLNVYAGLAGAYLVTDPELQLPTGLHPVGLQQGASGPVDYVVPLVIQDRSFDTAGELFFPNVGDNAEHPYWVPEFTGDTIAVNGKVWPFLEVEPRRYRFLIVNGSNARAYELFLANPSTKAMGPPIWQIGTDGGYLDRPVKIDPNAPKGAMQRLVLLPGERADVIIDFAGFGGQRLIMRNTARHPYPKGTAPNGGTTGRILQFRVKNAASADHSYDPASGTPLRPPMVRLANPTTAALAGGVTVDKTRQLTLNEVQGANGPLEVLVNNTAWDGIGGHEDTPPQQPRPDFTPVTVGGVTEYFSELPKEGSTELWEIVNLTADAHPIHLHLTQYQLVSRQAFDVNKYNAAYAAAFPGGSYMPEFGPPKDYRPAMNPLSGGKYGGNPSIDPYLRGPKIVPAPNEAGWKDTVMMLPGQVTRIVVRYAPQSLPTDAPASQRHYAFDPGFAHGYVWHCHIIDHEDNEMMRPVQVQPKTGVTRTYIQGVDY